MKIKDKIYILLGPTASGKSGIATRLSENFPDLSIINCDSKQIYKEIPILSAQPKEEEILRYSYQLYNHVSIYSHYNIAYWLDDAINCVKKAQNNSKKMLFVGGTGFYAKALMEGLSEIPDIQDDIKQFVDDYIENFGRNQFYEYLSSLDEKVIGKIDQNDIYRLTKAGYVFFQTKKSIFDFYEKKCNNVFKDCEFVTSL